MKRIFVLLLFIFHFSMLFSQNYDSTSRFYYKAYRFGSQSVYSPYAVLFNRGWDVIQCKVNQRDIFSTDYSMSAKNVINNWLHPIKNINKYGAKKFFTREILPINFSFHDARWVPNYSLHLIGGGQTYAELTEWFKYQQIKCPRLLSASIVLGCALINETLENSSPNSPNTDAIADFYFFDVPAILLFSSKKVNRFFGKYFQLADWSPMPSFTFPDGNLHNNGQYFSAKIKLPKTCNLFLFNYFGTAYLGGLSYQYKPEYTVSVGVGSRASRLVNIKTDGNQNVLEVATCAGIFIDRNNSLLASVVWADIEDYFCAVNLYPNCFSRINFPLGCWTIVNRNFEFAFGFSTSFTLGVGAGFSFFQKY